MIRVLQIVASLERTGPSGQMAMLSRHLPSEGLDVRVFSLGGDGPLAEELTNRGVRVIEWPARRHPVFRSLAWLRQAILDFSPHLVHTWPGPPPRRRQKNAWTGDALTQDPHVGGLQGGPPQERRDRPCAG